jgi:small subunit ribosomal protein S4
LNGKLSDIPSEVVSKADILAVRETSKDVARIKAALASSKRREIPQWLDVSEGDLKVTIRDIPSRDDVTGQFEERLVVELYSK